MAIDWVSSVVIAIPIAIVANLLTPWFSRQFEKVNARYANQQIKYRHDEDIAIAELKNDKSKLYVFLLLTLLKITIIYAFANIISQSIITLTATIDLGDLYWFFGTKFSIWKVTSLLTSVIHLVISLVVLRLARQAMSRSYSALSISA